MKKYLFFSALGFAFLITTASIVKAQDQKLENTLLWQITHPKMPADTSFLFGTVHVISKRDFLLKDKVLDAMLNCDVLVTEIDLTEPKNQKKLKKGMKLEDGVTLKKILKKKNYRVLNSYMLEGSGQSLDDFNDIKPFFVSSALMRYYIQGEPASYDMNLTQIAGSNKMDIRGLETIDEQLNVIDSIPYKEQAKDLIQMVKDDEKVRQNFDTMVEAYKAENLHKLDSLIDANMPSEDTRKILIDNRNIMWLFKIQNEIRNKSCFFAIGAGHLGGKNGLIHLLRTAGYEVKPVFDKPEEE